MQTERFALRNSEPVAAGSRHLIYQHPADRDLLIKVHRPSTAPAWYRFHRRLYGASIGFAREIREQLLVWSKCNRHPAFLGKIVGICETDAGTGMVVERHDDEAGVLARNLAAIVSAGDFDIAKKKQLAEFLDQLLPSPLYFDDLYAANIVYAFDKIERRYRFVLVDGIGHKTLIPVARLIPFLEKRRRRAQVDLLHRDISRLEAGSTKAH